MMWNFLRKSSDVIAAKDAEITDLKALVHKQTARAERAEAAHRIALETAAQRAVRVFKLEADLAEQSTKITTLSNLNAALKRKYEPVRGPGGKWVSKKPYAILGTVVSA